MGVKTQGKINLRIISRLDIKSQNVIKGVHLEGLKIVGKPEELSNKYSSEGADEIYFHDTVASLYQRNNIFNIVEKVASEINIPLTVSGGLRSESDVEKALISGADKVSLNTIFHEKREIINNLVKIFGSQAIVGSVEAKKISNKWIAFTDNGRTNTNMDVLEWIKILQEEGVGEIIVTSVDFEGTQKGFDLDLLKKIENQIKVPLIVSGGIGKIDHIKDLSKFYCVTGTAIASIIHYNKFSLKKIKEDMGEKKNIFKINLKKKIKKISIFNSKICNLKSLYNSFNKIAKVEVIDRIIPSEIDRLVLPGVGSFDKFSKDISNDVKQNIQQFSKTGKHLLGICLGAQFLFTKSYEINENKGLDLLKGSVVKIDKIEKKNDIIIPNIGWFQINLNNNNLLKNIPKYSKFYFIHSYNFVPDDKNLIISKIQNSNINAICKKNNIIACQFHPEKSGNVGIHFLNNFLNLN